MGLGEEAVVTRVTGSLLRNRECALVVTLLEVPRRKGTAQTGAMALF
jgi:hypothetical protein